MIIDLKRIFVNVGTSEALECELDMSDVEYMGEFPLKEPVKLTGTVSNRAGLVGLKAEITYVYEAPCDRCGVMTSRKHLLSLDRSLAVSIEGDDSDTIITVPDMKLDADEFIYAEVITSLPMKHLCNEDCKGICFKCGKNLNEGKCGCPEKEIDPRLAALAELLD